MQIDQDPGVKPNAEKPRWLIRWSDRGASLVEYAMLVALIAIVALGALTAFGEENEGLVDGSKDRIVDASSGGTP